MDIDGMHVLKGWSDAIVQSNCTLAARGNYSSIFTSTNYQLTIHPSSHLIKASLD